MTERKVAKKLIKIAKKHPNWYTKQDVAYAKLIRKSLQKESLTESQHYVTINTNVTKDSKDRNPLRM